jgi:hypothetical protein
VSFWPPHLTFPTIYLVYKDVRVMELSSMTIEDIRTQKQELIMFNSIRRLVVYSWDFVFNHEVSPLRHIPDVAIRHYVLQGLGLMWAAAFAVAAGSYTFFAVSVIGHTVLIAAAAITVTTWTAATVKPDLFVRDSIRK